MNKKGFTLIELLIVVAIIGIVAAIAIPNLIVAIHKGKQKATIGEMKTIGTAIGSYNNTFSMFPDADNLNAISFLEPHFVKTVVKRDGWNFNWHYTRSGSPAPDHYSLGSGGKGGAFTWAHSSNNYVSIALSDFENDIILSEGIFTFAPRH